MDRQLTSRHAQPLTDGFQRQVSYLRLSVTDRCDLRCIYCMDEEMQFLPRQSLLSFEEILAVARVFVANGVRKVRLTGGEPLIRKGIVELCAKLKAIDGLDELCITTNATRLNRFAQELKDAGVDRVNISLDTLQSDRFKQMTRVGDLNDVLAGIDAAIDVEFKNVKLNAVVLKNVNQDEILDLTEFAIQRSLDLTFIEEMPLGEIAGRFRGAEYCSSDEVKSIIGTKFSLVEHGLNTGGPARYAAIADSKTNIGFISPHSHNFCGSCNRLRLTSEGKLLLCLGQENALDLRALLRSNDFSEAKMLEAIQAALQFKPEGHNFNIQEKAVILRHMNVTGG